MNLQERAAAVLGRLRARAGWLDHLVQAGRRYSADQGNQLAAAVTYFSFLSLFPLLLLTVSVLGFVLAGRPDLQAKFLDQIGSALPGQSRSLLDGVIDSRQTVGLVALLGLLYSGLGWVANLRTAIRTVWHQNVSAGNVITAKLHDLVVLVGLGLALAVSVVVSGVGNAATSWVTRTLHLGSFSGIATLTRLATIGIAMVANLGVFLWLFGRLTRVRTPWRRVIKGAAFAAVGFEILKLIGAYYVARTTRSATAAYGTLGVVIGALVWINVVSRFVVFAAVWTVTAPYQDDVSPSGTASPDAARRAGVPEQFAQNVPDDASPNRRTLAGAPTPLTPALMDAPGVGYGTGPERAPGAAGTESGAPAATGARPDGGPSGAGPARPGGPRWPVLLAGGLGLAVGHRLGGRAARAAGTTRDGKPTTTPADTRSQSGAGEPAVRHHDHR